MRRFAIAAMGTRFELVLPVDGPGAQAIGECVLADIEEWHARLNRFANDSWVSHVNRTAATRPVRCDDAMWGLLVDAYHVWEWSAGAFDVTLGDGDALHLDPQTQSVSFGRPGMALDFGGIAKGHAVDSALRLLRDHYVSDAFIHGGTSSGAGLGTDGSGRVWKVGIGGESSPLELSGTAFSLSDAASQSHSHIEIGGSPVKAGRAVVVGPSARLADALSTAVVAWGTIPGPLPDGYSARMY